MPIDKDEIIRILNLQPLRGEGGYYAETYRSVESLAGTALPGRYGGTGRSFGTAIYYLLSSEPDSFSALHRLKTDEMYHFYLGDPVEMLLIEPGGTGRIVRLGPDLAGGECVQFCVPAGVWQGSRLVEGGAWALMGTTMAPGFDPMDFELGERAVLAAAYPQLAPLIQALTRA